MPYEVISDTPVTVLKSYGALKHPLTGDIYGYDEEAVLYRPGDIIPDEEISPTVVKTYEEGNRHTRSVLKRVSVSRAKKASDSEESAEPKSAAKNK